MAIVMAAADEVREDDLIECRRMDVRRAPHVVHSRDQVERDDEESKTQRRKERLAEAADVDDAAVGVETVEAGNGTRPVPELAVVVVFDDPRAGLARPVQQREPPAEAHMDAGRKLVRWR